MKRYSLDPRWTFARFDSRCHRCNGHIKKGDRIFYYPNGRTVYCDGIGCGEKCSQEFNEAAQDEDNYNGGY